MRIQFRSIRDKLDFKESGFSALAAEYYYMTSENNQLLSDTNYERVTERGHASS